MANDKARLLPLRNHNTSYGNDDILVDIWVQPVRRALPPGLPFLAEYTSHHLVLVRTSCERAQPHVRIHEHIDTRDGSPCDRMAYYRPLAQERAGGKLAEHDAHAEDLRTAVRRMTHESVRAVGDKLVVLAHGQLEGEVPAEPLDG